jgi:four helix bundle protein
MARPKSYRDLIVWQKAMELARQVYTLTASLPRSEVYGLLPQLRRAAVSVPSNIAEGQGRLTDLQFRHFLGNARGSLNELQTELELAADLGYLDKHHVRNLMDQGLEVARLINGLLTSLGHSNVGGSANAANFASPANSASRGLHS